MNDVYANYNAQLNKLAQESHDYPADRFSGRGIVMCAGGIRYFTNAYINVSILRMHGCKLPIQFWHLGPDEMTTEMREIAAELGVECVDAYEVRKTYPARILNGWELKPYAIIHCPFAEVISLDADNVAVRDITFLFDTPEYKRTGAIFWPDFGRLGHDRCIWKIVGTEYRDEPEFESGQIVVNKAKCWKALQLTMHINEHSDFYYGHIHGDKETFHMAWRKIDQEYSMPARGIHAIPDTMCQHDFGGNRLFQHRNMRKWRLRSVNLPVEDFLFETECLCFLDKLRQRWSVARISTSKPALDAQIRITKQGRYMYTRVGYDAREIVLENGGYIAAGPNACEHTWAISDIDGIALHIYEGDNVLCKLTFNDDGSLQGNWIMHEKMPVTLTPVNSDNPPVNNNLFFRPNTWDGNIWNSIVYGNEYRFSHNDARCPWPNDVIDIGGHIGAFSYFAAHKMNARKIIVVEPDPDNFAVLQHNLADLIAAGKVVAINAGIGPENSTLNCVTGRMENTGGLAYLPATDGAIPSITLSKLLELVDGPVLLKIDCESCEYTAFDKDTDISKIDYVVGEFHSYKNGAEDGTQFLQNYFQERNYISAFTHTAPHLGLFGAQKA